MTAFNLMDMANNYSKAAERQARITAAHIAQSNTAARRAELLNTFVRTWKR